MSDVSVSFLVFSVKTWNESGVPTKIHTYIYQHEVYLMNDFLLFFLYSFPHSLLALFAIAAAVSVVWQWWWESRSIQILSLFFSHCKFFATQAFALCEVNETNELGKKWQTTQKENEIIFLCLLIFHVVYSTIFSFLLLLFHHFLLLCCHPPDTLYNGRSFGLTLFQRFNVIH